MLFYRIKDNQLYDFADYEYSENCLTTNIISAEELEEHRNKVIVVDNELQLNPNYRKEEEEKKKEQFHKDFFNTSLGYVRRKVSMQTGETKDFLADILPILQVGIPILTYTEDGQQKKVLTTEKFIEECKQQVIIDFYGGV